MGGYLIHVATHETDSTESIVYGKSKEFFLPDQIPLRKRSIFSYTGRVFRKERGEGGIDRVGG
jgi:hypothetical protein